VTAKELTAESAVAARTEQATRLKP